MYNAQLRGGNSGMCVHICFFKEHIETIYNKLFLPGIALQKSDASSLMRKNLNAVEYRNVGMAKI